MGKRLSNLSTWQWRGDAGNHQHPANLVLHLIAVPLFILAVLLLLDGVFSLSFSSIAIGVIGLIAARGFERHDQSLCKA